MFTMPAFQKKAFGGVDEEEVCDFRCPSIRVRSRAQPPEGSAQRPSARRRRDEAEPAKERQLVLSLREQTAVLTKENEALRARVEELEAGRAASEEGSAVRSRPVGVRPDRPDGASLR